MAGTILGIVGSPHRDGMTFQMVDSALRAAAKAGAEVELVQLADHVVAPCRDCDPWECMISLKCRYPDPAFDYLSRRLLECGALVIGTPVYWWDASAMVRYLILKMFRVYAPSGPLAGLPAFGISVAGGSGNGLVSGLRPLYHFFQILQMRALPPQPVTRFNWGSALIQAQERGRQLAAMAGERRPFKNAEERLLWFDNLPYLNLSRAAERRLLAALTTEALPDEAPPGIARALAYAEDLVSQGRTLESLEATASVYEATAMAFDDRQG
jgi:multimeric flavodoxin WrbA